MDFDQAISENDVTIQAIKDRLNIDPPHVLAEDLQGILMTIVQGRIKKALNSLKLSIFLKTGGLMMSVRQQSEGLMMPRRYFCNV